MKITSIALGVLLGVAALMVSACGTQVQTDVTTFHTLQNSGRGQSFVMVPIKSQQGSLEYQTYAGMVSARLAQKGLVPVAQPSTADLAVFMSYAIDEGRTTVSSAPVFGQTGGGTTTTTTGYVGRSPIYATSYTPATYGITGYAPVEDTVYGRAVRIVIIDIKKTDAENKPVVVYQATGASSGSSGNLNVVMPAILNAMFIDWPAPSGTTHRRQTPLNQ